MMNNNIDKPDLLVQAGETLGKLAIDVSIINQFNEANGFALVQRI